MWKGLKEFFYYPRSQRNGIFVLMGVIILLQFFLYVDDFFFKPEPVDREELEQVLTEWKKRDSLASYKPEKTITFFNFDPNTATEEELKLLGLSDRQAEIIVNYRSKGGKFRQKDDLLKIYSIDTNWYLKAKPYVSIASNTNTKLKKERVFDFRQFDPNTISKAELENMGLKEWQARMVETYRTKVRPFQKPGDLYKIYGLDSVLIEKMLPYVELDTSFLKQEPKEIVLIELNSADTNELTKIKGIGRAYARRIVKYRQLLGGFVNKEQLLEVYGMDSTRYQRINEHIEVDISKINRLNVNTATFKELLKHPYLSYEVVQNIVNFRNNVRPFKKVDELKNIELVDEDLMSKIAKYLTVRGDVESDQ